MKKVFLFSLCSMVSAYGMQSSNQLQCFDNQQTRDVFSGLRTFFEADKAEHTIIVADLDQNVEHVIGAIQAHCKPEAFVELSIESSKKGFSERYTYHNGKATKKAGRLFRLSNQPCDNKVLFFTDSSATMRGHFIRTFENAQKDESVPHLFILDNSYKSFIDELAARAKS